MMHDEISDTENIRKLLAIDRSIIEGCDILLDAKQTFIREGVHYSAKLLLLRWLINILIFVSFGGPKQKAVVLYL